MVKLRNALMAVALGMGLIGCYSSHWSIYHCDECDDFPLPAQGSPTSMMPGTYTGPPPKDTTGASPSLKSPNPPASGPSDREFPAPPPQMPPGR